MLKRNDRRAGGVDAGGWPHAGGPLQMRARPLVLPALSSASASASHPSTEAYSIAAVPPQAGRVNSLLAIMTRVSKPSLCLCRTGAGVVTSRWRRTFVSSRTELHLAHFGVLGGPVQGSSRRVRQLAGGRWAGGANDATTHHGLEQPATDAFLHPIVPATPANLCGRFSSLVRE